MSETSMPTLSIVVPVYRSAATLRALHRRIADAVTPLDPHFELILVEDGGGDDSWSVIEALANEDSRVRGFQLSRNFGQHNALLCGIRAATRENVITLDDDLQNPPEVIPQLLAKLAEGFDVVYGTPTQGQHGALRNFASGITKLALQSAMGVNVATKVSAYRAFRADIRQGFADYRGLYVSIDVLLTWATTRFSAVEVPLEPRAVGESNYTLTKLIRHALNMVTGFSVLPLQLASVLGFGFTLFGFLVLLYVVGRFLLEGGGVPGFPFLASIVAIFSGVQLFALGIIGEYLARVHLRSLDRPPYVVRHMTDR